MSEIQKLIDETERNWRWYKSRGKTGQIEALACRIRIQALQDALAALPTKDPTA